MQAAVPVPLLLAAGGAEHLGEAGHHHADYGSVALVSDAPLSAAEFQRFLDEGLGPHIVRGKGFFAVAETGTAYLFHLVGRRFTLDPAPAGTRGTRLVLIGKGLDAADLRARLEACLDQTPR